MSNFVYSVEYSVKKVSNGEEVDSNVGGAPLEFITGKGQMIAGFDKEVSAMEAGEEKAFTLKPEEAYGPYNEEMVQEAPKEQFEGIELAEGMTLYGQTPDGQTVMVTVKSFNNEVVTIDHNHPLAGEEIMFNVKVISKREATADEVLSGVVGGKAEGDSCCGSGCGCSH
jgi:FKBP-type peptidyl-prolyl cis-trans isomerase SlyD